MRYHLLLSFVSIANSFKRVLHVNLLIIFIILASNTGYAQFYANSAGNWTTTSIWSPSYPGVTGITADAIINDYVIAGSSSADQDIEFASINSLDIEVHDTLIVYGNIRFLKNFSQIRVYSGGVLVVFGSVQMGLNNTGIVVEAGGVAVVTGDVTDTGGGGNPVDLEGAGYTYVGGDYSDVSDASTNGIGNPYTDIGDDGFEDIQEFITKSGSEPLPVTLKSFVAAQESNAVGLQWTTLTEENFDYFEIQRAGEDGVFEVLSTIKGSGNSKTAINYEWYDESPLTGINYYRLESVDFDGYRETFQTKMVVFESSNARISIGPNPAMENGTISFANAFNQGISYTIYDLQGHLQIQGEDESIAEIKLPSTMTKGIYIISYEVNGLLKREKLVVQ